MSLTKVTIKTHQKKINNKSIKIPSYFYYMDQLGNKYGDPKGKTEFHPPTVKMTSKGTPILIQSYKRPIKHACKVHQLKWTTLAGCYICRVCDQKWRLEGIYLFKIN